MRWTIACDTRLLLVVCLMATDTLAGYGCCRRYTTQKIPFPEIRGFSVQTMKEFCSINAIIFHTKKKGKRCTDPTQDWVMDYVERLGPEALIVHHSRREDVLQIIKGWMEALKNAAV
ncbi:C-C motif chemokine 20a.3 [Synchiropus splendidus]|uniref:C-C motif chemokine 20a.3 n=1 Tax=Synchiropus splendidus TaxID=270530 RepID=UPI00237E8645|nr:C-C motif chemokine 20a.3 [Synchiropus splendidus]